MTPLERYQEVLKEKHFKADVGQQQIIECFEQLYHELQAEHQRQQRLFQRLKSLFSKTSTQGLYLWGGVGRGKTWLMDLFYETLPTKQKYRLHFHRYIQEIHEQLEHYKGQKNPLKLIARQFSRQYQLLCLDELHVADITDAMILHGLLKALIENNVTLIFTSNLEPDELYRDGLQRERFIPAIELIKHSCHVQKIPDGEDHRLNTIQSEKVYFSPLSAQNQQALEDYFLRLSPCQPKKNTSLEINHRSLPVYGLADDVAWFIFDELFNSPRAVADYIELARLFHTVVISEIPLLTQSNEDKSRRFIQLMDEFYDRNVKVIISAETSADKLYHGKTLTFDFERTVSRIEEMKSLHYLQKPHKA